MRDIILIVCVILMFIGYAYVSEVILRCKRRKQNPRYGCVPDKPTPPPMPPKHYIVTDCDQCKGEPNKIYADQLVEKGYTAQDIDFENAQWQNVDGTPLLKSYRYKNIWYDVTVQSQNSQHACQLINQIFKEKNQPLVCFADMLTIVE